VHGGLLGVRGNPKHESEMESNDIHTIDLVIMNLYPFESTVASGAVFDQCVENIDIGGPSMLRSSAKNHAYVAIVTSPTQYPVLISELMGKQGSTSLATRKSFASQAFALSAAYDTAISAYFSAQLQETKPPSAIVTRCPLIIHLHCLAPLVITLSNILSISV
jgi:phosphoribosylaminoimidazolecarboxamide formyltransferase / IMP cyclohydrolase